MSLQLITQMVTVVVVASSPLPEVSREIVLFLTVEFVDNNHFTVCQSNKQEQEYICSLIAYSPAIL